MLNIKDLKIGDKIREINPYGYKLDSIIESDPYQKDNFWYVVTIAKSNEFLEYRQRDDNVFFNIVNDEIKIELVYRF